ncbi:SMI1/KNR4 family protein [Undibacterium sp. TJN25]|uniref:SMI1/KNR4 family protein n=1 Tax=Undibacterium sp. TJN25 TaxID=3413056 RepID=UPI003BF0AC8E
MNDIKQIFLDKNALERLKLNPGATADELQKLEQHLGVTLPAELKQCLSDFNGQEGPGIFLDIPLLSIERIREAWDVWYDVGADGVMNDDCAEFMSATPEGYVKPMYTNPKMDTVQR